MSKPLTGRKVFTIIASGFAVIIGANLTLAYNAIHSFPGLETKNSYISSQTFDADRKAQDALGWDVRATMTSDTLILMINNDEGHPVRPQSITAVFGRATHVKSDQDVIFTPTSTGFRAPIIGGAGNWNLRMVAIAADGTRFQRRLVLHGDES